MKKNLSESIEYSAKSIEYDEKRINIGKIENPSAYFKYSGPCGDTMEVYLNIKSNVITDVKFQTTGCTAARSSGSAVSIIVDGKILEDAEKITTEDIIDHLDGLPPPKKHCACLARTTLLKAIEKYKKI
ncbi:MAG: iron-sulfur cluster assembly scaffold protein [Bacteroidales bacterium]|nr:iron-sulfur cluster assembly scaffold protein [Bacteroidales bacterium]